MSNPAPEPKPRLTRLDREKYPEPTTREKIMRKSRPIGIAIALVGVVLFGIFNAIGIPVWLAIPLAVLLAIPAATLTAVGLVYAWVTDEDAFDDDDITDRQKAQTERRNRQLDAEAPLRESKEYRRR